MPPSSLFFWCAHWNSNPDWNGFKPFSSANWDMGAKWDSKRSQISVVDSSVITQFKTTSFYWFDVFRYFLRPRQGDDFHVPPQLTPNKSALNSVGKDLHLTWYQTVCPTNSISVLLFFFQLQVGHDKARLFILFPPPLESGNLWSIWYSRTQSLPQ